jgi:hypothetical protein
MSLRAGGGVLISWSKVLITNQLKLLLKMDKNEKLPLLTRSP